MSNGLLQGVSEGLKLGLQGFVGERDRRDKRALAQSEAENKRLMLARQLQQDEENKGFKELGLLARGVHKVDSNYQPQKDEYTHKVGDTLYAAKPGIGDELGTILKGLQIDKAKTDIADAERKKTPQGKLESLPVEARSKVGNVAGVLKGLTNYEDAFRQGERPEYYDANSKIDLGFLGEIPIGGLKSDTKISLAQKMMNEDLGRLQSGGAITSDEINTFNSLGPRPGDSDEIRVKKLLDQRKWMESKLAAFGFKPEQLAEMGFNAQELGYGTDFANQPNRGLIASKPVAPQQEKKPMQANVMPTPKTKLSPEDAQALQWAKQNPKDPRSAAILKANGM